MSADRFTTLIYATRATRLRARGLRFLTHLALERGHRLRERAWATRELAKMNRRDVQERIALVRFGVARYRRGVQALLAHQAVARLV